MPLNRLNAVRWPRIASVRSGLVAIRSRVVRPTAYGLRMTRTTPARPVSVEALFPELALYRARTTRLHPRPGRPDDVTVVPAGAARRQSRRRADAVAGR
jgi:hypothetical protein